MSRRGTGRADFMSPVEESPPPPPPGAPAAVRPPWRSRPTPQRAAAAQARAAVARTVSPTGAEPRRRPDLMGQQGAFLTTSTGAAAARHRPLAARRARAARPSCRTTTCARRSPTSTTSGSPSGSSTPAVRARTASSSATAAPRSSRRPRSSRGTSRHRCSCGSRPSLGSRGSADTVRDTRGFATKFYTEQGNFDLVGNNIPVFFIQDGIKFPDVIHAVQAAPRPGDPAGAERPRHLLGLRLAAHRGPAPHDLGHVRPRASPARTGTWRASGSTPSGWSTPRAPPRW